MIPDPRERPTLTVPEAGALVGLGRSASFDAVKRGEIPALRFGRRLAVPTARLLEMLGLGVPTGSSDSETPAPRPGLALVTDAAKRGDRGSG